MSLVEPFDYYMLLVCLNSIEGTDVYMIPTYFGNNIFWLQHEIGASYWDWGLIAYVICGKLGWGLMLIPQELLRKIYIFVDG